MENKCNMHRVFSIIANYQNQLSGFTFTHCWLILYCSVSVPSGASTSVDRRQCLSTFVDGKPNSWAVLIAVFGPTLRMHTLLLNADGNRTNFLNRNRHTTSQDTLSSTPWEHCLGFRHCSRKCMQQSKKMFFGFWLKMFLKMYKKHKSNDMWRFRDHSISFCPVSVSIKLLKIYFNQQFYIMLYVNVIVCCFGVHSVS